METPKPLVSIIVPCYNQARYLPDALSSVLRQTHLHWECIIVNDGSQDDTEEVALEWLAKDNRFKYISKVNGGLCSARNTGIEKASGLYILPLDADDYISENYVEVCLNVLLENPDCKIAYGEATLFGEKNGKWNLPEYNFTGLLTGNMIFCTALFARKDWEFNNGYDKNLVFGYEDWEFWINLLRRGGYALRNDGCTFYYRISQKSMALSLGSDEYKAAFSLQYIFNKHEKIYTQNKIDFDPFQALKLQRLELERLLAERDAQLAERDAQLAERDAQLAERDAQLAERDAQLAERDAQLAEIQLSKAWQLAVWLSQLYQGLKSLLHIRKP